MPIKTLEPQAVARLTSASPRPSPIATKQEHRPARPKQKRNKPTLSCRECVERKTKCDRGRPTCLACTKRSSNCKYSDIAEILASNPDKAQKSRSSSKAKSTTSSSKCSIANITIPEAASSPFQAASPLPLSSTRSNQSVESTHSTIPVPSISSQSTRFPHETAASRTPVVLSSLSLANDASVCIFGIGGEHPFANYWTCSGGIAEVVGVLPSKDQADILITRYFEIVDPVYPVIDREEFTKCYDSFWAAPPEDRDRVDAAVLALHFVIYATATQYLEVPVKTDLTSTAEFYISAAHQALRISSYMNHITIPTVQAMLLTFYFLINDNHVSDAWTIVGLTVRQSYVLQLNRNPEVVVPHASKSEKRMRCKLWHAIIFQDIAVSLFLKLAPSALISDVGPRSLQYQEDDEIEAIRAHRVGGSNHPLVPWQTAQNTSTDVSYVRSMWLLADFVREVIVIPRALGIPLCKSHEHQRELISGFRNLYRSLPEPFGSYDNKRFLVSCGREARQQMAFSCNFFHAMMLITADENPTNNIQADVMATLEATHQALAAFFAMVSVFGAEVNGWWAYQHRAFEAAMTAANTLASQEAPTDQLMEHITDGEIVHRAHAFTNSKDDIVRMLAIIIRSRGYFEFQSVHERRLDTLQRVFDSITIC